MMAQNEPDRLVRSFEGVERYVCRNGQDCSRLRCACAHPNMSGSVVKHPRWCLFGPMNLCVDIMCPFNHFRTQVEFVNYRMRDEKWAWNNVELVLKYSDQLKESNIERYVNPYKSTQ